MVPVVRLARWGGDEPAVILVIAVTAGRSRGRRRMTALAEAFALRGRELGVRRAADG